MSLKIDKGLAYLLVYSLASNEDAIDYDKSLVIKVFEKFGIDKNFFEEYPNENFDFPSIVSYLENTVENIQNCIDEYNALEREENSA